MVKINTIVLLITLGTSALLAACNSTPDASVSNLCSSDWYHQIEKKLQSADGQGHGPDIGSDEWKSVIEFKLGLRGSANVPAKNSAQWCDFINNQINNSLSGNN